VGNEAQDSGERLLTRVSTEVARLYTEQFGREPTRARSDWAGPDALVVRLETSSRRRSALAEMGEHQRQRDTRLFFQHPTESTLRATIEELTGRSVRAFVSGLDAKTDTSSEVFYFEPLTARGREDGRAGP